MELASATSTTKNQTTSKVGVWLIATYFFILAVSKAMRIMIGGERTAEPDVYVELNNNTIEIYNVFAWIGVCFFLYVGIQLMRSNSSGWSLALFVYWPITIIQGSVFVCALMVFIFPALQNQLSLSFSLSLPWGNYDFATPLKAFLYAGFRFLFMAIPLYFLLRKDTKALFQKPATTGETNPPSVDAKEQSL